MQGDPRLGFSGGVAHRAQSFVAKVVAVVLGGAMLAGAFVVSLAFFAFALAAALVFGGYLWWKTRDLRRRLREQMRQHDSPQAGSEDRHASASGRVIEGVVISKSETRD
jgi:hypothetical protein